MKKLFLLSLCLVGHCFAVNLKVTEIVRDHNLYILENKYVIQSSARIENVKVGSKLDIDTNMFYGLNQWVQDYHVTDYRYVDTVYTDHYDSYGYYTHTSSHDNYAYDTYTYQYTFYPIGIVDRTAMNLSAFKTFVLSRPFAQPLFSYSTVFMNYEWIEDRIEMKTSYFTEQPETLQWVLNELEMYDPKYTHKIYPIFDRNYPDLLAGVLHFSKMRKVFLFDHTYGLAIFQRQ